jgi:hypothetical protein
MFIIHILIVISLFQTAAIPATGCPNLMVFCYAGIDQKERGKEINPGVALLFKAAH